MAAAVAAGAGEAEAEDAAAEVGPELVFDVRRDGLEHTGHPDDSDGLHYDLLLEDPALAGGPACRTWRLSEIPRAGGGPVAAQELPPHRLEWLEREAGAVSGNRGFARRIDAGTYTWIAPPPEVTAAHCIRLQGGLLSGDLAISPTPAGLHARLER